MLGLTFLFHVKFLSTKVSILNNIFNFALNAKKLTMGKEDINRLKAIFVEQKRTAKWLTEQARRAPATVSEWCTNTVQLKHDTLRQVANIHWTSRSFLFFKIARLHRKILAYSG